jgi:hypothetical protein
MQARQNRMSFTNLPWWDRAKSGGRMVREICGKVVAFFGIRVAGQNGGGFFSFLFPFDHRRCRNEQRGLFFSEGKELTQNIQQNISSFLFFFNPALLWRRTNKSEETQKVDSRIPGSRMRPMMSIFVLLFAQKMLIIVLARLQQLC